LLQKGWGWGKGLAEERRANAEGGRPPISPSERHVPREPAGCAKPIITASERELREIKRCWMIIGMRSGGKRTNPKVDNLLRKPPRPQVALNRSGARLSSGEEVF
jgi:hypothetical protein